MKFFTVWFGAPVLVLCLTGFTAAQDSTSESDLSERVAILEAEVSKLRAETMELRKLLLTPQLALLKIEDEELRGKALKRYRLTILNNEVYDDEMFRPAPELGPIGRNKSPSRTFVHIYSADGGRLYGFVAFNSNDSLEKLWFAVPEGATTPDGVYVVLHDRAKNIEYKSNVVSLKESQ